MQRISDVVPLTHGIEAARELAAGGTFADVAGLVGTEALIGLAYGVLGYAVLRFMEWQSRVHATLETA
jgi:ABC-2 type transport system permease protein